MYVCILVYFTTDNIAVKVESRLRNASI